MQGKYSPTVQAAYFSGPKRDGAGWHVKLRDQDDPVYDVDGYDSYGYNVDDVDRAGNNECDYYSMDGYDFCNLADQWTFDGTRPVLKSQS